MRLALALAICSACGRIGFDLASASATGGSSDGGLTGPHRTITLTIAGPGAVTSTPPGLACATSCVADLPLGPVTLTAVPAGARTIDWTGAACSGTTCALSGTGDAMVGVSFGAVAPDANRVFVTSETYQGALKGASDADGIAGADRQCSAQAAMAGLSGTFIAFLSSATLGRNAIDRLAGSRGWVRVDGSPVFATPEDIVNYRQLAIIDLDATGARVFHLIEEAWLGGTGNGMASGADCQGFTSAATSGNGVAASDWAILSPSSGTQTCNQLLALFCFQIGNTYDLPPAFPIGRTAFISSATLAMTGVGAADAACQADATAAQLSGTYVAALATSTQSISDRIGGTAGPWRRPDGAVIATGDLGSGDLLVPISTLADGSYVSTTLWTGAASDLVTPSPAGDSCSDWTSASSSAYGYTGFNSSDHGFWLSFDTASCDRQFRVICLQHP